MPFDSLYPRTTVTRRIQVLDGTWDFAFDREKVGEELDWPAKGLVDAVDMPVPASFADIFTDKESREFCGGVTAMSIYALTPPRIERRSTSMARSWRSTRAGLRRFAPMPTMPCTGTTGTCSLSRLTTS